MSSQLKLRRGSTVSHSTFTGADGEVTFNTDTNALVSHDGVTAGGFAGGGFMPAGTNAVATAVQTKLREFVSVKDFGAVGDGIANDTEAFNLAALEATTVVVPEAIGAYLLNTDVSTSAHWILEGTLSGPGKLLGLVERQDARVLAIGQNTDNAGIDYQGLQIGGGNPNYGTDGNFFVPDGHATWTRLQPSKNESSIELVLYSTGAQGKATAQVGTSTLVRVAGGSPFQSSWVGHKFYFGGGIYTVTAVASVDSMTVANLYQGVAPFASTFNATYHFAEVKGNGLCSISGTTVTRISGDPFIPFITSPFQLRINGVLHTVSAYVSPDVLTLSVAPGNSASISYAWNTDINNQLTTFRVQKVIGADEENLSIYADYSGYHLRSFFAGDGTVLPIYLGTANKNALVVQPNGDVTLGGSYESEALRIISSPGVNRLETQASNTGYAASLRARGSDANVSLALDMKGTGELRITQDYTRTLAQYRGAVGSTSWLAFNASSGNAPAVLAEGASSNIDISFTPKGTGEVSIIGSTPVNSLKLVPGTTGAPNAMKSRGTDTNVGITIDTQAAGNVNFSSHNFANIEFQVFGVGGSSWLAVGSSAFDTPILSANGAASNIDVRLAPKGTGAVWLGAWTTSVDAAINGYITVKDASGNTRKLATIA